MQYPQIRCRFISFRRMVLDQGIDIYAKETEIKLAHSNNIFDDTEYGNSMFNPPRIVMHCIIHY